MKLRIRMAAADIPAWSVPRRPLLLVIQSLALATGFFALVEPAPIDVVSLVVLLLALVTGRLVISRDMLLPCGLLLLFLTTNLLPMFQFVDLSRAGLFFAITSFLAAFWLLHVSLLQIYARRGFFLLMSGYVVASFVASALCILAFLDLGRYEGWIVRAGRPTGFFKDPNVTAPFLVLGAAFSLWRIVEPAAHQRRRWAWFLLFALQTFAVIVAASRAAYLNYVITIALFLVLAFRMGSFARHLAGRAVLALAGIALGLGVLAFADSRSPVYDMVTSRLGMQHYDQDRFNTQFDALQVSAASPVGIGPGQAELTFERSTHSLYLRALSENGIIGLLAILLLLLFSSVRSWRIYRWAPVLEQRFSGAFVFSALAGSAANSFFIDTLHWRHFWLLLAFPWMPIWRRDD